MTDIINQATSTDETTGENQTDTQTNMNTQGDLLDSLVGEGKKFKDAEALAKAKVESDSHISKVEEENRALREKMTQLEEQVAEGKTFDKVLDEINKSKEGAGDNQTSANSEEIADIIEQKLKEKDAVTAASANRKSFNDAVLAHMGGDTDKAVEFIRTKAKEAGLDNSQLTQLSEKSPQALVQLFGLKQTKPTNAPSMSQGNVKPTAEGGKRNFAYYQALRREIGDSKFYSDQELMAQKIRDSEQPGFYD